MYLTVKNVGKGRSFETQANLRNLSGDGLLLHDGRFDISNMQPGDVKTRGVHASTCEPALADPEAKVQLQIRDERSPRERRREGAHADHRIRVTVGGVRAAASAPSRRAPISGTRRTRRAACSARLPARDRGERRRATNGVRQGGARRRRALRLRQGLGSGAGGTPPGVPVAFEDAMAHAPPSIEIPQPQLATRDAHTLVHGAANDDAQMLDAYIFVGSRKVFYRSNRNGPDPKHMAFDADLPLRPGVNVVTVVARENPDTTTRRTFIVRRDGPNGELLPDAEDRRRSERDRGERRRVVHRF